MNKLIKKTRKVKHFLSDDIWSVEMEELSKAKARFVKYMKVLLITIKTFSGQKIGFQAVALSFFSTMSVVPLVAIVIAVTGGLGLADNLKELLYQHFNDNQAQLDIIIGFANNIIDTAQSGGIGFTSTLVFLWLVIWLMLMVEKVFNNVWKVEISRNIFKRLTIIISMLLIAPLLVLVFFAGSMLYTKALGYLGLNIEGITWFKTLLTWIMYSLLAIFTFSAMYKFIPNATVKYSNALIAAAFSGVSFIVMQYMYHETQIFVTRLNTIYGAFAALPLLMLWLNIGWFIILIGAELSYAFQHVDDYNIDD